ncbi:MAG: hypothetical protein HC921_01445 [Synechococcaceae cyanobacterium SM2_3_1]|nr:hypothetical protein [Synechococcaceae cyanobacterium SM2_3_1]
MKHLPRPLLVTLTVAGSLIVLGQYLQGLAGLYSSVAPYSAPLADGLLGLTVMGTIGLLYWGKKTGLSQRLPLQAVSHLANGENEPHLNRWIASSPRPSI